MATSTKRRPVRAAKGPLRTRLAKKDSEFEDVRDFERDVQWLLRRYGYHRVKDATGQMFEVRVKFVPVPGNRRLR